MGERGTLVMRLDEERELYVPTPACELKVGDEILAYVQLPGMSSRHFGMEYEGFCIER